MKFHLKIKPSSIKDILVLFKVAFKAWKLKDPFRQSAVIAYFAIFSLPALLVVIIAITGFFMERDSVTGHIESQIASTMGKDTSAQISSMIENASDTGKSTIATIIGIITILFGASGVFIQMQKTLNLIWKVEAKPSKKGILIFLRSRLFSFGLILSICFLLLTSLIVSSALAAGSDWLKQIWPDFIVYLFAVINFILSFAVIAFLFALMFRFLPDVKIKWSYVRIGAIITALLFTLGKFAMGLYFGKASPESVYGTAGSIVLILLWVSYSSMIVLFGAEFTKAYADFYGAPVKPEKFAVKKKNAKPED